MPIIGTAFTGQVVRCIPHPATEPLSGALSREHGGRWNPPGSFPVLYTFLSRRVARTWVEARLARGGIALSEVQPEALPDLLVLECHLEQLADLATDAGLKEVGLPSTYPIGFETEAAYPATRPIGMSVYSARAHGVLTRSATATSWEGPVMNWGEIAIFTDYASPPILIERLSHERWL